MRILLLVGICLILSGCYCNLRLSQSKLHSIHKFEDGFHISKITVDSFTADQIPLRFIRDTTIRCYPYCYEYPAEVILKIIHGDSAIHLDTCNFRPTTSIYFNKTNSDYKWKFVIPYQSGVQYDTLPIKFTKGNWYEIRNVCEYYYIYFYVKANGSWLIKEIKKW